MSNVRLNSLSPIDLGEWRWEPFFQVTVECFSALSPKCYPISKDFLAKEASFGGKRNQQKVKTQTWACSTKKLRQLRAACVDVPSSISVFNFLVSPFSSYDLPFFGADFVTLPSGHLLALDFQPVIKEDLLHTEKVWERLIPLYSRWNPLLPSGGSIPVEAESFFSPGFLWSRIPLGDNGEQIISEVLLPAYKDYLSLYLDLVNEADQVSHQRSKLLLQGQNNYLSYRAKKDPARGMLSRFYGNDWTESYIKNILFDL